MEKADPTMLMAVSNRIICHMKLFNFEEALADINMLMSKVEAFPEEKRNQEAYLGIYRKT